MILNNRIIWVWVKAHDASVSSSHSDDPVGIDACAYQVRAVYITPNLGPKLSRKPDMEIEDLLFQFKESSTDSEISLKPLRNRRSISCSPPARHRRTPMRPERRRPPSTDSFPVSAPGTASASVWLENHCCHSCNDGRLVSSKHVLTKYGAALEKKVALGKKSFQAWQGSSTDWRSVTRVYKKSQPRHDVRFSVFWSMVYSKRGYKKNQKKHINPIIYHDFPIIYHDFPIIYHDFPQFFPRKIAFLGMPCLPYAAPEDNSAGHGV